LFLVAALWFRSPRRFGLVSGLAVALGFGIIIDRFSPGELLSVGSLPANALGLELSSSLSLRVGADSFMSIAVVMAVALALLMTLGARLVGVRGVVIGVACLTVVTSYVFAVRGVDRHARAVAATIALPQNHSWIDRAAGRNAHVLLLNMSAFMPEIRAGDYFSVWAPWWATEFWNRSARSVFGVGAPEPLPLPQGEGAFDWGSGTVGGAPPTTWVLSDPRFVVAGTARAASDAFVLYQRPAQPLRLVSAEEGVYRAGLSTPGAVYDHWARGDSSRQVGILVATRPIASRALLDISVGSLTASGSGPAFGHVASHVTRSIRGNALITVTVPPAPYRIQVLWRRGDPGYIRFTPKR
jgi:hypothetical protein